MKTYLRSVLRVVPASLLLGIALLLACLAVSEAGNRLEADRSQRLARDLAGLHAAWHLEEQVARLRAHSFRCLVEPSPEEARHIALAQGRFEEALAQARQALRAPEQVDWLNDIAAGYERYRSELGQAASSLPAGRGPDLAQWEGAHPIRHVLAPCRELVAASRQTQQSSVAGQGSRLAWLLVRLLGTLACLVLAAGLVRVFPRREKAEPPAEPRAAEVPAEAAPLGQLVDCVADEIVNPLTGIKMIIDVARRNPKQGDLTEEDLQVIHSAVQRMNCRMEGLLQRARPAARPAVLASRLDRRFPAG